MTLNSLLKAKYIALFAGIFLLVLAVVMGHSAKEVVEQESEAVLVNEAADGVMVAAVANLPLPNSAPETNVSHTIPLAEIKRGCFRQDCIPSVDQPEFIDVTTAEALLGVDALGIALSYKGENRFYPFGMLVTREIVNDEVAGDPLLITYCPLCGTGIVFDRTLDGDAVEFGVSGMLWQSNLLMYNRADMIENRNLWSQVLGQAVVGERAGESLSVVPSDIARFSDWSEQYPGGEVLTTGAVSDPYNGRYYEVAQRFAPNFDETTSVVLPTAQILGVVINDQPIAIQAEQLVEGTQKFMFEQTILNIEKSGTQVQVKNSTGDLISDVEGMWFSWKAAHPDTGIAAASTEYE